MAGFFLFANNANSTLAAPITNTATSLSVAAGQGALFPNPSAGQQFALTLTDAATGTIQEIMYCTARTGDALTVLRAQEGTTARAWLAGDIAANMCTAGQMAAMQQVAAINPARTITASGAFVMSNADAGGGVGLKRVAAPATSSTTLPATATNGMTFAIEDLAGNFNAFPVTVNFPGGTTGPNGRTSVTLNVNGQCAIFRFYGDSNTWSFKP